MNLQLLVQQFENRGYNVAVSQFGEIDLERDFKNTAVLYHSSEKQGGFYKSYIEDIVYYLEKKGSLVLPKFEYLKAHHNKVYMELIRKRFENLELKTIKTYCYGSSDEALNRLPEFPIVLKISAGAGSNGVKLAKNEEEYRKAVKELSRIYISDNIIGIGKDYFKAFRNLAFNANKKTLEQKFIVQTFVPNLLGDYKVLYFGGKYYTLYRKNRDNDFRASGGGKLFLVPDEENIPLLNFAKKIVAEIDFPIIGIDIGHDGHQYHLLEFQMIHLGPYTLQFSDYYYIESNGLWNKVEGKSVLEEEFVRSIAEYIEDFN
jgi:glutathione synthase/RimK-type ligase-like ATP-grasp enzyme